MSSIHITHNYTLVSEFEKLIGRVLYRFTKLVAHWPWLFALFALITFGFLYTLIAYLPILMLRRKTSSLLCDLSHDIDKGTLDERAGMELNLELEDLIPKLKSIAGTTKQFFVFSPVHDQLSLMYKEMSAAQVKLSRHLYPDAELTTQQGEELIEAFKSWNDNFHTESLTNG